MEEKRWELGGGKEEKDEREINSQKFQKKKKKNYYSEGMWTEGRNFLMSAFIMNGNSKIKITGTQKSHKTKQKLERKGRLWSKINKRKLLPVW